MISATEATTTKSNFNQVYRADRLATSDCMARSITAAGHAPVLSTYAPILPASILTKPANMSAIPQPLQIVVSEPGTSCVLNIIQNEGNIFVISANSSPVTTLAVPNILISPSNTSLLPSNSHLQNTAIRSSAADISVLQQVLAQGKVSALPTMHGLPADAGVQVLSLGPSLPLTPLHAHTSNPSFNIMAVDSDKNHSCEIIPVSVGEAPTSVDSPANSTSHMVSPNIHSMASSTRSRFLSSNAAQSIKKISEMLQNSSEEMLAAQRKAALSSEAMGSEVLDHSIFPPTSNDDLPTSSHVQMDYAMQHVLTSADMAPNSTSTAHISDTIASSPNAAVRLPSISVLAKRGGHLDTSPTPIIAHDNPLLSSSSTMDFTLTKRNNIIRCPSPDPIVPMENGTSIDIDTSLHQSVIDVSEVEPCSYSTTSCVTASSQGHQSVIDVSEVEQCSYSTTSCVATSSQGPSELDGVYCVHCDEVNSTACAHHPPAHHVLDAPTVSRARQSLPDILYFNIKGRRVLDVHTRRHLPVGTRFGPLIAALCPIAPNTTKGAYFVHLVGADGSLQPLDTADEHTSNWMTFVSSDVAASNLVAVQEHGAVYFIAKTQVLPGDALRVWPCKAYARHLGLPYEVHGSMWQTDAGACAPPDLPDEGPHTSPPAEVMPHFPPLLGLNELNSEEKVSEEMSEMPPLPLVFEERDYTTDAAFATSSSLAASRSSPAPDVAYDSTAARFAATQWTKTVPATETRGFKCVVPQRRCGGDTFKDTGHAAGVVYRVARALDARVVKTPVAMTPNDVTVTNDATVEDTIKLPAKVVADTQDAEIQVTKSEVDPDAELPSTETEGFACNVCQVSFLSGADLVRHASTQHGPRPVCPVCSKSFSDTSNLNQHMKIHNGIKNFECPVCAQRFRQKHHLVDHMLVHTKEKKHVCSRCTKTFARMCDLKVHESSHTSVKPYSCADCGKSFQRLHVYKRHLVVHSGKKDFLCDFCRYSFLSKYHVKRHMDNCKSNPMKMRRPLSNVKKEIV